MRFETKEYFHKKGQETFYPYAEVVFEIKDSMAHYHIPLLLSPYGYTFNIQKKLDNKPQYP